MPSDPPIDFLRLLRLPAELNVDCVVIGGLALHILGGAYVTYDAGFAFSRRRENARAIASALAPYHPMPVDWPGGVPFVWDEGTVMSMAVLTLTTDLGRVDFLAEPEGAPPYERLKARADTPLPCLSLWRRLREGMRVGDLADGLRGVHRGHDRDVEDPDGVGKARRGPPEGPRPSRRARNDPAAAGGGRGPGGLKAARRSDTARRSTRRQRPCGKMDGQS